MGKGIVKRITGPVVDIEFSPGEQPEIRHAVNIMSGGRTIKTEVVQNSGRNCVRCIALSSTDGIYRGCAAVDTGAPISVPVGEGTLGRMFNVAGEPIDGKGRVDAVKYMPIHRDPPSFTEVKPPEEMLETGIKVVDLLTPYAKGGKIGLFGGAGVG